MCECVQRLIKQPSAPVNTEAYCSRAARVFECEDDEDEEDVANGASWVFGAVGHHSAAGASSRGSASVSGRNWHPCSKTARQLSQSL